MKSRLITSNRFKKISRIQGAEFYMVIVVPLRRSSLRKMIQDGHTDRQINLRVLKSLKLIVCSPFYYQHGDLKEKCNF